MNAKEYTDIYNTHEDPYRVLDSPSNALDLEEYKNTMGDISERFGIPLEEIELVDWDTLLIPYNGDYKMIISLANEGADEIAERIINDKTYITIWWD